MIVWKKSVLLKVDVVAIVRISCSDGVVCPGLWYVPLGKCRCLCTVVIVQLHSTVTVSKNCLNKKKCCRKMYFFITVQESCITIL